MNCSNCILRLKIMYNGCEWQNPFIKTSFPPKYPFCNYPIYNHGLYKLLASPYSENLGNRYSNKKCKKFN